MIGQYLPNNNETVTVAFRQKIYQLNSLWTKKKHTKKVISLSVDMGAAVAAAC
jgi:hypothetical protein